MLDIPLPIPSTHRRGNKSSKAVLCSSISSEAPGNCSASDHKGKEENWHAGPFSEKKTNADSAAGADWNRLQHLPREQDRAEQLIWEWAVNQDWFHTATSNRLHQYASQLPL